MKKPIEQGRTAYQLTLKDWRGNEFKAEGEADEKIASLLSRLAVLIQTRKITPDHPVVQSMAPEMAETA